MASNLAQRVGFAAVAIPVALGLVWLGGWPLAALVGTGAALGVRELFGFAVRQGTHPLVRYGIGSAALLPPVTYAALSLPAADGWAPQAGALWLIGALVTALWRRPPGDRPLASVAITVLGVAYAAGLPSFLLVIRHAQHGLRDWAGTWLVFVPMVIVWVGDSVAMFAGRAIGGARLAPTVSPGKTWAGSIAEVVACVAVAPLLDHLALRPNGIRLGPAWAMAFGLALGVLAQVGDLTESLFKREVGVKDSSDLIPGHGGVLDRFDALYFALPVAAALYKVAGVA